MNRKKRSIALALALCILLLTAAVSAAAPGETLDITYVTIEYDGFVADTMDGVDAVYNITKASPDCGEIIVRYYETIYGLQVALTPEPEVIGTDEFWFEETQDPQRGDILYAKAEDRGVDHYGLCRSYDAAAGRLSIFEQNWIWNGQAPAERIIAFPGVYRAYALCSEDGAVAPQPPEQTPPSQPDPEPEYTPAPFGENGPSEWAQTYVLRAEAMGIISRREGGYQQPITRVDYARLVVDAAIAFTGMLPSSQDVCQQADELGLMSGDGKGNFREYDSLTRQEGAVVMERLLKIIGNATAPNTEILGLYADKGSISWWAQEAVSVMTQVGLMGGTGTGFSPKTALTLEQAITLLMRVYDTCGV